VAQPEPAVLTVILAAKDPHPGRFEACIASVAALDNSSRIDLVIVASGSLPAISDSCRARLHRLRIIEQEPRGIYEAYNRGLDEAETPYVMVIGSSDLLLPGLDEAVDSIPAAKEPHIMAACALMQGSGVTGPSRFRWGLVFRNWCQQGILYRTDLFASKRFDCKYRIQADHKLNMALVSDPRTVVVRRSDVVCHFSSGGLSQTAHDWVFREDMPRLVREYYGCFFGLVALAKKQLADWLKGRSRQMQRALQSQPEKKSSSFQP
jgi:glycosyltransferase involved in cell wall biosynthesis